MTYSPSRNMRAAGNLIADCLRNSIENHETNQRYWQAIAHRARLIDTDEYVKTSEIPRLTIRWGYGKLRSFQTQINQIIRKMNQDMLPLLFDPTMCWCGRQSCSNHQENS